MADLSDSSRERASVRRRTPWAWVPSLYFAEGMPNVVVTTVSLVMFVLLEVPLAKITFYTAWLYLPWVIKPLWSPLVDVFRRKRWWILSMQLVIGGSLAGVALTLPGPDFFRYSLIFLWLLAFSSATHDIAADGFYMIGLEPRQQAYFVGIRNTFYRIATMAGQGGVVVLAGELARWNGIGGVRDEQVAWSVTFGVLAVLFFVFWGYHRWALPRPAGDVPAVAASGGTWRALGETFTTFFRKPGIGTALAFMLLYRLAEAQLVKVASPFLLADRAAGGLGLSAETYGVVYGTIGVIALLGGGIAGGVAIARGGLRRWIGWMVCAMNLPNLVYLYLAWAQPASVLTIGSCVVIEQLGYGFGFTAYMFYLLLFADGSSRTAHYAICTGFMALGMMLPGMFSGAIQEAVGYPAFFGWVMVCTIPSFAVVRLLRIPDAFGKK